MKLRSQKGFGLIILVSLIVISGILLGASSRLYANAMQQTQLRIDQTKAHYLAQAGVMRAVWDWYKSDTTTDTNRRWAPLNMTVTGNQIFKVGLDSAGARLHSNFTYFTSTSDLSAAPAWVRTINTAANTTNSTSIAVTVPSSAVPIGDYVIVSLAMDANRLNPTCTDNAAPANIYTRHEEAAAAANANEVRLAFFSAPVTTALSVGRTITCSWTNNCTAKAIVVDQYTRVSGFDPLLSTSNAAASGTAPSSGVISSNYGNELIVGAIATEGPTSDTYTVGSGYAQTTRRGAGAGTSAVTILPEYKVAPMAGDYVGDATIQNRGWAASVAGFIPPPRWTTSGANRRLSQWQIYNINNGNSITLAQMKISWTGGGTARLNEIRLNNAVVWTGTGTTGTTFNITDTVINNGAFIGGVNTWLQWNNNGPADPVTITCQFIFSGDTATTDAKTHNIILWDGDQAGGGLPGRKTFNITSTGQVNQTGGTAFKVLKTIRAVVSGAPGVSSLEITYWNEGDKNIP